MNPVVYKAVARELLIDSVLVLAMRSPYPTALTAVALAGTAWQCKSGVIKHGIDALLMTALLSIANHPVKLTDAAVVGGALLWCAGRVGLATGVFQRPFSDDAPDKVQDPRDYILSEMKKLLSPEPEFQSSETVKWDKEWSEWGAHLEVLKNLPQPSKELCLEELLKRDMTEVCEAGLSVDSAEMKQFMVDLRHCLSRKEMVTIGDEKMTAWKEENSTVYCLLNRSKVLTALLSASWATGGKITCRIDLLALEQFLQVSRARTEVKLNLVTLQMWSPEEVCAICKRQGKDQKETKAVGALYGKWLMGMMSNEDDWLKDFFLLTRVNIEEEQFQPSEEIDLDTLLTTYLENPLILCRLLTDLFHRVRKGRESVTIGSSEAMEWKKRNPHACCVLNRPTVLVDLLSDGWADHEDIQCAQGLLNPQQWEQVREARKALKLAAVVEI